MVSVDSARGLDRNVRLLPFGFNSTAAKQPVHYSGVMGRKAAHEAKKRESDSTAKTKRTHSDLIYPSS